ncbi:hypothetical protein KL86PLE_30019 [uncultured Pleomorphomonas sp.]|uniref:DUF1214 domain-containing protein n=1 Tax=uncultured Pleomorphomonas sp. TaxID=442121 RepID=A0A212LDC8_9HYPH|nr:DUF1214 domain-containing protein [uncultured Pleomorphomonas sp.]SCM75572.1 hypothetical protein KL86PLE_30019 [uncultured Pleomorphomonas sp.]
MLATLRFILVILAGILLGLVSAWWAVGNLRFEGSRTIGQWSLQNDGAKANPYEAVRAARRGGGGLGPSEGIELTTEISADGKPLAAACAYLVAGPMPQGVLWTLTVSDRDGRLPGNPARRVGFTSLDAMTFGAARQIRISIGRDVRPGDFVATTGLSSLRLTLRLYSPTLATRAPGPEQLPTVTSLGCQEGEAS